MNNSSSSGFRFLTIIALLIGASFATYAWKVRSDRKFESAKETTTGIITKVVHDVFKSEYASYERYLIEYEYKVEDQLLSKVFECKPREIADYFGEQPERGDSIMVAYNGLRPSDSKPVISMELSKNFPISN